MNESDILWEDCVKLWESFEITLTEFKNEYDEDVKLATFQFKSWEDLKWIILTFHRQDRKYAECEVKDIERYLSGITEYGQEEIDYWKEKDEEGWDIGLITGTVLIFPKKNCIEYSGYSFHHFFQHMFDWLPRRLNNILLRFDNRELEIARYIDDDTNIPISRGMISRGFGISSQKYIDEVYQNSIKKFLVEQHNDERFSY